jgi:hypothetical protein
MQQPYGRPAMTGDDVGAHPPAAVRAVLRVRSILICGAGGLWSAGVKNASIHLALVDLLG